MWIKRAAYLCSYTPTKLFMFLNQRNDHEWIILLCTSSIVTGTCLSPRFQTGVDVRICVVFLLLRISRSKLYLHRTNEALLICWSTCMISWSCKGATCFVELLLERLCHQFSDFSLAETIFVSNWVDEVLLSPPTPKLFCQKLDLLPLFSGVNFFLDETSLRCKKCLVLHDEEMICR